MAPQATPHTPPLPPLTTQYLLRPLSGSIHDPSILIPEVVDVFMRSAAESLLIFTLNVLLAGWMWWGGGDGVGGGNGAPGSVFPPALSWSPHGQEDLSVQTNHTRASNQRRISVSLVNVLDYRLQRYLFCFSFLFFNGLLKKKNNVIFTLNFSPISVRVAVRLQAGKLSDL